MSSEIPLEERACVPCRGGVPPLTSEAAHRLLEQLRGEWQLNDRGHLAARYDFPDFVAAMRFANQIAEIAEAQKHHPDLTIRWGVCEVEIWTHKIDGLAESDFVLAAKIERAWTHSAAAGSSHST